MSRRARLMILAAATLLALALAIVVLARPSGRSSPGVQSGSRAGSSGFAGAALPAGVRAPGFTLTDQARRRVSLSAYRGGPLVLAFLSTSCRAACVLAAQQVRGALDLLPRPVPVLFVSVDPGADTPARVARFLRAVSLGGRAEYLSGSPAALRRVWGDYRVPPFAGERSAFERALTLVLIDARGRERVLFGLEQLTPEALAHDIGRLRGG